LRGQKEKNLTFAEHLNNRIVMDINKLSGKIIGAAIEVHKSLGPGLLESAYEECLCYEFGLKDFSFERQKALPVTYKGKKLDCGYRLDIVVENTIILELKSCNGGRWYFCYFINRKMGDIAAKLRYSEPG
jgi:hypothetical protein